MPRPKLILSGQLMLPDPPERMKLRPGTVILDDGHIAEVIEGDVAENANLGGPDCLICPGFIDTHVHLPQFDSIGAHGLPLLEWLQEFVFPAEAEWADETFAAEMTERVIDQCFAFGTTAIAGYATVHHGGTAAALAVAANRGMKGVIGQVLMDRGAPDFLVRDAGRLIDETAELLGRFPPGDRMAAAVTPRFAICCTPKLLSLAGGLAAESGSLVQTHLSETLPECRQVRDLFDGQRYVDVYRDAGLLTPRSLLGHGVHLGESDRRILTETESVVAHCPTANSFLRSGTMDRSAILRDGVRISLGSDIAGGYERSMVRVARAMIEAAASFPGGDVPSASAAWWTILHGNAAALGRPDGDRWTVGQSADFLVIRPDIAWQTSDDPTTLARLMFAWDDRWLRQTIVRGEVVYGRETFR